MRLQSLFTVILFLFCGNMMAQTTRQGDVNHDGSVDISDIVAVINTIAGETTYSSSADVNKDNNTDISDIVAIINIIANGGGGSSQTETDAAVETGLCPDNHHPHAIDLGIGVKFACCNVGASSPEEYGGYYAWGETEEKDHYDSSTYKYYNPSTGYQSLGSDISGTQYDVAHVKWDGGWHMPSYEQLGLLTSKCTSTWTSVNGVYGRKVTGPNGASIFLPAAGYRWSDYTYNVGISGDVWSSTQYPNYSDDAYYLGFGSGGFGKRYDGRYDGRSVRPVTE
ncbi:MAG: hypothetical protein IJ607_01475 [Bacteroidaceae bacterium]|nr:hypothetical protein [Bacteroidaceae bacterium]